MIEQPRPEDYRRGSTFSFQKFNFYFFEIRRQCLGVKNDVIIKLKCVCRRQTTASQQDLCVRFMIVSFNQKYVIFASIYIKKNIQRNRAVKSIYQFWSTQRIRFKVKLYVKFQYLFIYSILHPFTSTQYISTRSPVLKYSKSDRRTLCSSLVFYPQMS